MLDWTIKKRPSSRLGCKTIVTQNIATILLFKSLCKLFCISLFLVLYHITEEHIHRCFPLSFTGNCLPQIWFAAQYCFQSRSCTSLLMILFIIYIYLHFLLFFKLHWPDNYYTRALIITRATVLTHNWKQQHWAPSCLKGVDSAFPEFFVPSSESLFSVTLIFQKQSTTI